MDKLNQKPCCNSCEKGGPCSGKSHDGEMSPKSYHSNTKKHWGGLYEEKYSTLDPNRLYMGKIYGKQAPDDFTMNGIVYPGCVRYFFEPHIYTSMRFPHSGNSAGVAISKNNTLNVVTNNNGCAIVQINFGQFLTYDLFTQPDIISNPNKFGKSNVFVTDPNGNFDGSTAINDVTTLKPSNVMASLNLYNTVRAGCASVSWDYTGRMDANSGQISIGIAQSFSAEFNTTDFSSSGLNPDLSYTTQKAVEDCRTWKTAPITTSMRAIYIPEDTNAMNYKNPKIPNPDHTQRVVIVITGATPNSAVGRLQIVMNYEGKPNVEYSDLAMSSSLGTISEKEFLLASTIITSNKSEVFYLDTQFGVARFGFFGSNSCK